MPKTSHPSRFDPHADSRNNPDAPNGWQRHRTFDNHVDVETATPLNMPTTCTNSAEHGPVVENVSANNTSKSQ
ncbi:hypothetical protein ANCDUO_03496 [Ancylostoma duodenale]|uniref:Uncharacterized protein n=1 Tax=Ancylostoma duodenale TaxID=51022 RepID=A0A0C2H3P0_9BILA|nr:hypothetical protein ANCDUO_03496 [Ancylostoma duodenale]